MNAGRSGTRWLVVSVALNVALLAQFGLMIHRRGGVPFLRERFFSAERRTAALPPAPAPRDWYTERGRLLHLLPPVPDGAVVFIGDSLTHGAEWSELFPGRTTANRGISTITAAQLRGSLDGLVSGRPAAIFLLVGINDLRAGREPSQIAGDVARIATRLRVDFPSAGLFVQAVMPSQPPMGIRDTRRTLDLNRRLAVVAANANAVFIDTYAPFNDGRDRPDPRYLLPDGVHLTAEGYFHWKSILEQYVDGATRRAAITRAGADRESPGSATADRPR